MATSNQPPPRKPVDLRPETGADANSMSNLLSTTAGVLKSSGNTVTASSLKPGTPYNVGHDMSFHGEGAPYGSQR